MSSGNYKSKSEIKRLFKQSAVKIDGEKVTDINSVTVIPKGTIIQIGKGKFYKIN